MLSETELADRVSLCTRIFGDAWTQRALRTTPKLWSGVAIYETLSELITHGFGDPVRLCRVEPNLLYIRQGITGKLSALRERGFVDPVKLCTKMPAILGYTSAHIDVKLTGLSERGFCDPVKLCTSMPSVLGYSLANIDAKMRLARRLGADCNEFLMYSLEFMSMSRLHYIPLLRSCRALKLSPTPRNVRRLYRKKQY